MLKPYILNNTSPDMSTLESALSRLNTSLEASQRERGQHSWAQPIFRLCATMQTRYLTKLGMTPSEMLLVRAVQGVQKEVCRVLTGIWASGVELELDCDDSGASLKEEDSREVLKGWGRSVRELVKWLDWDVWAKCRPACQFDEVCYLPTWIFFPRPPEDRKSGEWTKRPEPRCWDRIHPL